MLPHEGNLFPEGKELRQSSFRFGHLLDSLRFSHSHLKARLSLAFRLQNGRLTLAFRLVDVGPLAAFRLENRGCLGSFGLNDLGTTAALRPHLLLHRLLDVLRRIDVLQFHAIHLHTPLVRGIIQNGPQLRVDGVSAGQTFIKFKLTQDISKCCLCQFLDGLREVLDFVNTLHRIDDLEIDQTIDFGDHVVPRDDALTRKIEHGLPEIDALEHFHDRYALPVCILFDSPNKALSRAVDEGNDDVDAGGQGRPVTAEPLDDHGFALLDDAETAHHDDRGEDEQGNGNEGKAFHVVQDLLGGMTMSTLDSARTTWRRSPTVTLRGSLSPASPSAR